MTRPPGKRDAAGAGHGRFRVGPWEVLPRRNLLRRGSERRRLEPLVMDLLVRLARSPGEVVGRDELFREVWEGRVVGDEALTRAVSALRKALGDDARRPRFVETVPKRGYRLVARPEETGAPGPSSAPGRRSRAAAALGLVGLIVLASFAIAPVLPLSRIGSDQAPAPPVVPPVPLDPRPLTSLPGVESEPALSPSGDRVAFSCRAPGRSFDLCLQSLETDRVRRPAGGPLDELAPAWSPDGGSLAYARRSPSGGCSLWIVELRDETERRIGSCGAEGWPSLDWSPDGALLAVSARWVPEAPYRVALLSLADGGRRVLSGRPEGGGGGPADARFPAFSPDGRLLAWSRQEGNEARIRVAEVASGERVRDLAPQTGKIRGLDWSADGGRIVLSSNRDGSYRLWTVPADGGALRSLGGPRDAHLPAVGGRHGLLSFVGWRSEINLWLVPGDGSPVRRLFPSTRWDLAPALSPDGGRVAFVSHRSGSPEIWAGAVDDHSPIRLTRFGGAPVDHPSWSPDGERIVFEMRSDDGSRLWEVPVAGGAARPLVGAEAERGIERSSSSPWRRPVVIPAGFPVRIDPERGMVGEVELPAPFRRCCGVGFSERGDVVVSLVEGQESDLLLARWPSVPAPAPPLPFEEATLPASGLRAAHLVLRSIGPLGGLQPGRLPSAR